MIFQTKEEVAAAMAENPEQWAGLFLDAQETLNRFVKTNQDKDYNIALLEQMLRRERGEVITELTIQ